MRVLIQKSQMFLLVIIYLMFKHSHIPHLIPKTADMGDPNIKRQYGVVSVVLKVYKIFNNSE